MTCNTRLKWFKRGTLVRSWFGKHDIIDFQLSNMNCGVWRKWLWDDFLMNIYPDRNYMFKVNNRNTRTRCEICSELTIKRPERRQWCHYDVFIVNFEHISHPVLVFLLLTLSR